MIEIDITEDQRQRAKELYEFNVLKGSVTEGKGNEVGALGEVIVWDQFKKITEYVGSYDYDMIIRGKKVDVKTKLQNFEPKPYHRANIFAYNIRQKCDYYCFVAILSDLSKGWVIGWKEKDKFFEEAIFKKKGEVDNVGTNEGWVFKGDCYCLNNDQLDNKVKERSTSIN